MKSNFFLISLKWKICFWDSGNKKHIRHHIMFLFVDAWVCLTSIVEDLNFKSVWISSLQKFFEYQYSSALNLSVIFKCFVLVCFELNLFDRNKKLDVKFCNYNTFNCWLCLYNTIYLNQINFLFVNIFEFVFSWRKLFNLPIIETFDCLRYFLFPI